MSFLAKTMGSLVLASFAAACAAASASDTGSSESGVTVTPTGNDQPGQLVITVPEGVDVSGQYIGTRNELFLVDGQPSLAMTVKLPRTLSVGAHSLDDMPSGATARGVGSVAVTIQNHALTTVALGGISYHRSGADSLLGIDATSADIWYNGSTHPHVGQLYTDGSATDYITTIAARIAGTYHYDFGLFDGFDAKVEPGTLDAVDVDGRANRKQLRIVAPDARALPDAACSGLKLDARRPNVISGTTFTEIRTMTGPSFKPLVLPLGAALVIGEYVGAGSTPVTYTASPVPLAIAFGPVGGEPATLKLDRIDVTDVDVKQTDGSTVKSRGSYTLYQVTTVNGADVQTAICRSQTNTGVDVGPGRYHLVVDYDTVEAGPKQDMHDLTIP